jgi:hypothetical protein
MSFLLYGLPFVVFVVMALIIYSLSEEENKNDFRFLFLKDMLPSLLTAILVFYLIKNKDDFMSADEPMKSGDFFDNSS